ncbi:MAG: excinuclease ABC subunit UvrA [Deltaproteobacteria bacterium]|nr:excinuclease ABC subunit UvrA [Deltaproteobacteria bacterium]
MESIVVRGARQHNLKNIDVEVPREKLVVVTGLSGSGKSSLAFDTIYAEGQRRYVESLSAYARQFLERMEKPDIDSIDGLSPAISIEQKSGSKNPRSTVGTVTEIYDYLRLLYARVGQPHCPSCAKPISCQTVQQVVDRVLDYPDGTRFSVLAPIVRGRRGEYRRELEDLRRDGFVRVAVDGEVRDLSEDIVLDKSRTHEIDVYVDRLVRKDGIRQRLTDSCEIALRLAGGLVKISPVEGDDLLFSERFACIDCGISLPEVTPRMFSFNNPAGACTGCGGLGELMFFDPDLIVPDGSVSLKEGAIAPWGKRNSAYFQQMLDAVATHFDIDLFAPWERLDAGARRIILHGSSEEIEFTLSKEDRRYQFKRGFEGVIPNLERRVRDYERRKREEGGDSGEETYDFITDEFQRYMNRQICGECSGARLRKEALCIRLGGKNIRELTALSIAGTDEFLRSLSLGGQREQIAKRLLREIGARLRFLINVGLDYLSLDRGAATLSGGEGQRIRLATQIGSSLVGVLYVLDEPSIGLHQRDNDRLIETLVSLRDLGNTVLVVEHDRDMILAADHVIDMGPGAGVLGGHVVATGTPAQIMKKEVSLTGRYLSGARSIPIPQTRRMPDSRSLVLRGARANNLADLTVRFPIGVLTCVTGVSGSGKSTLVIDTLLEALRQRLYRSKGRPGEHEGIEGVHHLDKVIDIDQSPIGRTPRSNPATYTGVFTHIRDLFAALPESKARGYKAGRYSFNVKGGRCEACQGDGILRIEMHFLPDIFVTCEECGGRRYNRETLEVRFKGKNIAEVLDMTVAQAYEFLGNIPKVRAKLETLKEVGLDYLTLGQSATTLSGGEAQRIKLSRELARRATGRTLYILDEPTTGLHFADIQRLLEVLDQIVDAGNTVIVIEHNLDVVKTADWVIDLGPEGGTGGGRLVASGTPEAIARVPESHTGRYLKPLLHGREVRRVTRTPRPLPAPTPDEEAAEAGA